MNAKGERFASINFFELSRTTVKSIKLMNLFRNYLSRSFVTINLYNFLLVTIQNINSLYHLAWILLEQKYKVLIFIIFEHVNQLLSLSSTQFPWKTSVSDGVCHNFDIGFLLERVFPINRNDFWICCELLTASLSLECGFTCKYIIILFVSVQWWSFICLNRFHSVQRACWSVVDLALFSILCHDRTIIMKDRFFVHLFFFVTTVLGIFLDIIFLFVNWFVKTVSVVGFPFRSFRSIFISNKNIAVCLWILRFGSVCNFWWILLSSTIILNSLLSLPLKLQNLFLFEFLHSLSRR